jgi:hypothetical protein
VGFWRILWGSIALGLDWSGKSMNHFVGWGFFSSEWIEQSRPTQLGSKGQFSGTGKRDLSRGFLLESRKWLEFLLGLFAQGYSESRPKSCPRWQTARAARDENALKLVATEKLSSFFLLSVREVLAVDKK